MIYLASPYSHDDPKIREERFNKVNKAAASLMSQGLIIFSPISHTHPIALAGALPLGWAFWHEYDYEFISMCNKVLVLKLEGWENSIGVNAEIAIAQELCIEIEYIDDRNVK